MIILYQILIHLAFILYLPKMLYQMVCTGKYRKNFFMRLFPLSQPRFVPDPKKKLVWFHGVSVGEINALVPLVERYIASQEYQVVVSTITETGFEAAKKKLKGAVAYFYLPFDFSYIVKKLVRHYPPSLLILSEGDYWWNFLRAVKEVGAKIVVVNGKMSQRSFHRLKKLKIFSTKLFSLIDLFCLQGRLHFNRFRALGIPLEKLLVCGNIKLDAPFEVMGEEEIHRFFKYLNIDHGAPIITAGSTHAGEEELILDQMESVWEKFPQAILLVIPRHPERFDEVDRLLKERGHRYHRLSQPEKIDRPKVVLIDAMGIVNPCYQISSVVVVCGSFTKTVGGHNVIEPCFYQVPVLFGPYMFSQIHLKELVQEYQAGTQVEPKAIGREIVNLLSDEDQYQKYARGGKHLIESCRGTAERIYKVLAFKS